ncbi:MAG: DUF4249 domain-containing protein [Flavobacteriales bacterium]|nr:DUF4249 domain-containing protein [Flavobacteriales bacterium]
MNKHTIYILFALFALSSCTERIDLDLNDQDGQRIVVDGWFTDEEKQHEIRLTWTTSYFFNEAAPPVEGAVLSITDGETTIDLIEESPGIYRTPTVAGTPGTTYTLQIDHNDQLYEASSYMRPVAPIDSLHVRVLDPEEEFGFPGDEYYSVRIWTQELPGTGDYYMWRTYVNGESVRDTLRELTFIDDQFYDGVYVEDVEVDYLDIEDEATAGDTVYIEQFNIGEDAYNIFIGIMNETEWNGGLFDAPPANVETNLSNGALGYFGAAGVSTKSTVIQE